MPLACVSSSSCFRELICRQEAHLVVPKKLDIEVRCIQVLALLEFSANWQSTELFSQDSVHHQT